MSSWQPLECYRVHVTPHQRLLQYIIESSQWHSRGSKPTSRWSLTENCLRGAKWKNPRRSNCTQIQMGARGNWALWREVASRPPDGTIADPIVGSFSQSGADWIGWTLLLDKFLNLYFCPKVFVLFRVCKFSENHHPNFQCFLSVGSRLNGPGPIICVVFWQISKFSFLSKVRNFSPNFRFLSLGAASLMWVRHWSVVIVPPVGGLKFWWDSEMCWCFFQENLWSSIPPQFDSKKL